MFSNIFSWESEQTTICNYIDNVSDRDITAQNINMKSIPSEFSKQFIIGSETKNNLVNESNSRYYFIHFMDDIDHPHVCMRGEKQGILEINESGQLYILDNHFNLMQTKSRFVFENGNLLLHGDEWLEHRELNHWDYSKYTTYLMNAFFQKNRSDLQERIKNNNDQLSLLNNPIQEEEKLTITKSYHPKESPIFPKDEADLSEENQNFSESEKSEESDYENRNWRIC